MASGGLRVTSLPVRSPRVAWRIASSLVRRQLGVGLEIVVPYDKGRSRVVADLRTALGLGLFRYGFWSPEVELVSRVLRPGDVFVDGGANVGLFALVAARCVGASGRVVCFEPASSTRSTLLRNVALNDYPWIDVRGDALGEFAGTGTLLSFAGDAAGLSSFAPAVVDGGIREAVSITTLDSALSAHPGPVRLVKLDLEGSEVLALRGARRVLGAGPDLIIEVESGHLERQGTSAAELVSLLQAEGYRLYEFAASNTGVRLIECVGGTPSGVNVFATRGSALVDTLGDD
jgi:FkbM family methyltransferase